MNRDSRQEINEKNEGRLVDDVNCAARKKKGREGKSIIGVKDDIRSPAVDDSKVVCMLVGDM